MFPSLRTFWISSTILTIGVCLLGAYLYYDCMANPGCSGESGIVFILLGLPWSMYPAFGSLGFLPPEGAAILVNIVITSFLFQLLSWAYIFFFGRGTSAHSR